MHKHLLWFAILLLASLPLVAQSRQTPQHIVVSTRSVPIFNRPPLRLLPLIPGREIAQAHASERFNMITAREIHSLASTTAWAQVESLDDVTPPKSGWVYWGESFLDRHNFRPEQDYTSVLHYTSVLRRLASSTEAAQPSPKTPDKIKSKDPDTEKLSRFPFPTVQKQKPVSPLFGTKATDIKFTKATNERRLPDKN